MHRNGYVREAALRQLAASKGGTELPYIFIRLNDWVAEIRHFAESAFMERLTPESATGLVQLLPLVGRLGRWSRAAPELESRITDVLSAPESSPAMLSGLRSDDVGIRRRVARLLIEAGGESLPSVLKTALQDKDVLVRTWAAAAARQVLDGQDLRDALEEIGKNRSARVRQEALIGWVSRFPEESHDRLVTALLDRLATVRGFAQFELGRRGFDVAAFYRAQMENPQSSEPIVGIGEVGSVEDTNRVEPYLRTADERMRIAAVHAIDRLGGDRRAGLLISALRDPAPAVSKAARRLLVRKPQGVDFLAVLSVFQEEAQSNVRRNSFQVLTAASKWSWLRYSLIAASDADSDIRADGLGQIDLWKSAWNRSFVEPTAQELVEIRSAVNSLDDELRANVLDRIGFFLGSVKPPIT
jgi:HEAT repeat protein